MKAAADIRIVGMVTSLSHILLTAFAAALPLVPAWGVLPLRDQWEAACRALSAGDAPQAVCLFREFHRWYGAEEAVRDPGFREKLHRIHGLAEMEAGHLDEAAGLLQAWFEENPAEQAFRAFLRFQLIHIHQARDDREAAARHRSLFLEEHPGLPECALIRWSWAEEAMARQDFARAREQLELVLAIPSLPGSGKTLATSALAMIALQEDSGTGCFALLDEAGRYGQSPVLAFWRSVLAPSMTTRLLAGGHAEAALKASAWFSSPSQQHGKLGPFLGRMQSLFETHGRRSARQAVWNAHWQRQLAYLEGSLARSMESGQTLDSLYRLRMRVLLEAQRAPEALILAQAILGSTATGHAGQRAHAYKCAIEACLLMEAWGQARSFAEAFCARHPEDPALPEILILSARTAAGMKQWPEALRLAGKLLESYPGHKDRMRWRLLQADWLLQSGSPERALEAYEGLSAVAPRPWHPFIEFQQARCEAALGRSGQAVQRFHSVFESGLASTSLKESALTEVLKLQLKAGGPFMESLATYRRTFPEGMNKWMVENLAAVRLLRMGNFEEAIERFEEVATQPVMVAEFAREQLSFLYRKTGKTEALRRHALEWIRIAMASGRMVPPDPFADCRHYQEATGEPAIPGALLQTLAETVTAQPRAFLYCVQQLWESYRPFVDAPADILTWTDAMAEHAYARSDLEAYATWQVFSADILDHAGRKDSADARRIQVIQAVDADLLAEDAAMELAQTARAYSFPEAEKMLEHFLMAYPDSRDRPKALFLLAGLLRKGTDPKEACERIREVVESWPDAAVHAAATLQLAGWQLEDRQPLEAAATAGLLLETDGLEAVVQAEALLIRAQSDFQAGNPDRGFVGCLRILALFPDLKRISGPAAELARGQLASLQDGDMRERITTHMEAIGKSHES